MSDVATLSAPTFEHHRDDPLGIDERAPRLSWTVQTDRPDWWQRAYEVEVVRGGDSWRSGRIDHDTSVLVPWPATRLQPRERARVRVRAWGVGDDEPSPWSPPRSVEAGLDLADWRGSFVGPDEAWSEDRAQPLVRRAFTLPDDLASARLYATAHGVYLVELNGTAVGDDVLAPGWTSYDHRLRFQTHDVMALLQAGENVIGAWLAPGWYAGRLGFRGGRTHIWGDRVGLLAQLEVTTHDRSRRVIATDETWEWAAGPITQASIYDGETFDARRSIPGWSVPGQTTENVEWLPTTSQPRDLSTLVAPIGPPVRCTEEIHPVSVERRDDALRLDFGVNLVGRLRLRASGPAGTTIRVRHAEVLEDGELGVRPLRDAAATDVWILAGDGPEEWEPRFTFHGFRHAEIEGWPGDLHPGDVVARVLHTDMGRTGWFTCSDDRVNQLHDNVVRSMRGNFLDVPTDCPQRDERLGWTGDLQVFADTASFLYDCSGTLSSWLRDVAVDQADDGTVPVYVPWFDIGDIFPLTEAIAVWGDVAVLTPWTLYQHFGDVGVLADQYDSARRWVERLAEQAPNGIVEHGMQLGDWLDPAAPPDDPADARADRYLVATAYLAHSAQVLSCIAETLDRPEDAASWAARSDQVRSAFRDQWMRGDGRLHNDAVTAYSLVLAFNLHATDEQFVGAGQRLVELVRQEDHRIATGFAGTPLVLHALTRVGADDDAARLLLQTKPPSWLYAVEMGATTIWERWDSMLPDGTINPGEMTSFNHYALGAVADWLHRCLAGISAASPGQREVVFEPRPPQGIDAAAAQVDSPYGRTAISWVRRDDDVEVEVVLPPNTRGVIRLPHGELVRVGSGRHGARFPARSPAQG